MSATAALCGWIAAGVAAVVALAVRRALQDGREAVTRACHELRGPLTAARLGLLLPLGSDDASRDRLLAIDAELCRAALALDDLAVARRGEWRGPTLRELEPIDIAALAAEAVRAAQGRARAAGATVTLSRAPAGLARGRPAPSPAGVARGGPVPSPTGVARGRPAWSPAGVARRRPAQPTVRGDRLRLAQALGNLIANAIEHGGPDVSVRVVTRADAVRVEVWDSGPGLRAPVAQLARRARRGRGARGRGLAIALEIARSHGGTVAAAPVRAGARVVLELPAGAAAQRRRRRRRPR
jgi:signal transduction histidine kinase